MRKISKTMIVPFTTAQMYDLVNAIEAYPQFLPWCRTAEIHFKDATQLKGSLQIVKGPLDYTITTLNTMQPQQSIQMQYVAGPFKSCAGEWLFLPTEVPNHSKISFNLVYDFKNLFTALAVEPVFNPIAEKLIDAFYRRAEQIYGRT